MSEAHLVLNAGSSSSKFGLYGTGGAEPVLLLKGSVDGAGKATSFKALDAHANLVVEEDWDTERQDDALFGRLLEWVDNHLGGKQLTAVGHRIVHGGTEFASPTILTPDSIAALRRLIPLAPLHQPRSLSPVDTIAALRPGLRQVACFDTAFHRTIEPAVARYAIPQELEAEGVRRYGFHGLSYQHLADRLASIVPGRRRVVGAHLGSGASLCAMLDGQSVDTTMGFSALEGLVMGTRPGLLDPGVLLYLMREKRLSHHEIEDMLYHRSGLLGLSGISSDIRILAESLDPRAAGALAIFAARIARETAAMANTLQGLDAVVFTGGIGEHSPLVRRLVCQNLAWLGLSIDQDANETGSAVLDDRASSVSVRVERADEEIVIATAMAALAV